MLPTSCKISKPGLDDGAFAVNPVSPFPFRTAGTTMQQFVGHLWVFLASTACAAGHVANIFI